MKAHIIKNGIVANTIEIDSLDSMPNLISAETGGAIGDTWDGAKFIKPIVSISKEQRKEELAALRYQKETAGIEVNGMRIKTDRESQSLLNGAYVSTLINPDFTVDWKAENGWITLDALQISSIANLVVRHRQSCFTREKELSALIDANPEIELVW